jgi:hypothetical protein
MNRFKLWSDSKSFSSSGSYDATTTKSSHSRPAPLRTVGTYDDDAFFNNVALNMISRYEGLSLSISEALICTLASPRNRSSFLDGLCSRLARTSQLSPLSLSLVQKTDQLFGHELRKIVELGFSENPSQHHHHKQGTYGRSFPPKTPRHVMGPSSSGSNSQSSSGYGKKKKSRSFFPDCEASFFRSRKVQNIDWKLTEAIEHVKCLRLDGDDNGNDHQSANSGYLPPKL